MGSLRATVSVLNWGLMEWHLQPGPAGMGKGGLASTCSAHLPTSCSHLSLSLLYLLLLLEPEGLGPWLGAPKTREKEVLGATPWRGQLETHQAGISPLPDSHPSPICVSLTPVPVHLWSSRPHLWLSPLLEP